MANTVTNPESYVTLEGRNIVLSFERTGPTTGVVSWTLPKTTNAYDGALVLSSTRDFNPSNMPTDGVKYNPSTDLSNPNNTIGLAKVIGAFYGDKTTNTISLTGLVDGIDYFFALHLVTSGKQYYNYGVLSDPRVQNTDSYAGDIIQLDTPPTSPHLGQIYFDLNSKIVQMWSGAAWIPASTATVPTANTNPATGKAVGDFFYNTRLRTLYTWDGTVWNEVEMQNAGLSMTDKKNVGTTGSYVERVELMDTLKKMLGWPVVCVELTEDHFQIAIQQGIQELRQRSDAAYLRRYFFMTMKPGQQTYYLNDPSLGTNKVTDVIKINRMGGLGLIGVGDNNIYYQQMIRDYYMPGRNSGQIDLVSVHLMAQLSETFTQLFAGDIPCQYYEPTRELSTYRNVQTEERVLVECMMEKTEQELLVDRYTCQWIQNWALSECFQALGLIRSKFGSLPGAGGGVSLNGDSLLAKAESEQQELLRQISDFEIGNGTGFGNYSFLMG